LTIFSAMSIVLVSVKNMVFQSGALKTKCAMCTNNPENSLKKSYFSLEKISTFVASDLLSFNLSLNGMSI
jgi:hypothetical protein